MNGKGNILDEVNNLTGLRTSNAKINIIFFAMSLSLGAFLRLLPTVAIEFPVGDGGLFYVMVEALRANRYHLPHYILFNGVNIPFAYPPLAFYMTGLITDVLHIPLIETFRWLPALIATATIPAFYFLALLILKTPIKAGLAMLCYALLPRAISWFIMGGGVTRSFGQLFLILTLFCLYQLFTNAPKRNRFIFFTILFSTLVVLTHPEAALHTFGLALLFWAVLGRSKKMTIYALIVGLGAVALLTPWLILMLTRFGIGVYQSAFQTGRHSIFAPLVGMFIVVSEEPLISFIAVLGVLGMVIQLIKRKYLLPLWLITPWIIDPRSGASISILSISMLASIALADIILPSLYCLSQSVKKLGNAIFNIKRLPIYIMNTRSLQLSLVGFALYSLVGGLVYDSSYQATSISTADKTSMKWIAQNVPSSSKFLVLSGIQNPFQDAIAEWFPALTESRSLNTIQGYEWLDGPNLEYRKEAARQLSNCMQADYACIEDWAVEYGEPFNYVYIHVSQFEGVRIREGSGYTNSLVTSISESRLYKLIYENNNVYVFHRLP
jgi:hypothetical protein